MSDPDRLIRIGSLENNGITFAVPGPLLDDLRKAPQLTDICGVGRDFSRAERTASHKAEL